jgi:hypothetical protein
LATVFRHELPLTAAIVCFSCGVIESTFTAALVARTTFAQAFAPSFCAARFAAIPLATIAR